MDFYPAGRHRPDWQDHASARGQSAVLVQGTRHLGSLTAALLSQTRPLSQLPAEVKLPLPQSSAPTQGMPALPQVPAVMACQLSAP
jgi:hypothetical protein